jgi:hypothetical protein
LPPDPSVGPIAGPQSPFANWKWPEFQMPEVTLPRPQFPRPQWLFGKQEVEAARNTWMQTNPEPEQPSPLQTVTDGARRLRESTRTAWRKTVDIFSPGEDTTRVAQREPQPSFWSRLFAPAPPKTPATVAEWMAQDRPKP